MQRKLLFLGFILLFIGGAVLISFLRQPTSYRSKAATNSSFVTRQGSQLIYNGKPFRFAGANIYWLGLDENVGGVAYPTHQRIDDVFANASMMGATVIRSHTLGITAGCALCLEPTLNQFNDQIFDTIDYSIKVAHDHNMKLIIPLIDQWYFYHGGKHNFTDWRGLSNPNIQNDPATNAFHHDPTVIQDFKNAIAHLLNHVNQYTGIALKDDPTIMTWETGNELFTWTTSTQSGSAAWSEQWTQDIATYIKSLAPNHLVADGRIANESNPFTQAQYASSLADPAIDMMGIHQYPPTLSTLLPSINAAVAANKVVYIGEYDWTGNHGGDSLNSFLSSIENSQASGDLYWDLFPTYESHGDGFTLHYPGDDNTMQGKVTQLTTDANIMSGLQSPPPTTTPEVIPSPTYIPVGTNLLQNPSFESATGIGQALFQPWWHEIKPGAASTISQDTTTKVDANASAKITVTNTAAFWNIQLYQHFALQANQTYTISFWAKAATPEQLTFVLQQSTSPNTIYLQQTFALTQAWQQFVLSYPSTITDPDTLLVFNMGAGIDTVWLDGTSLTGNTQETPTATLSPTQIPTVTNTPIPTQRPSPTITPGATSLSLVIKLHGLGNGGDNVNATGGNIAPLHTSRPISVSLFTTANQQVTGSPFQGTLTYDYNPVNQTGTKFFLSTINLPSSISNGFYTLRVSSPGFLSDVLPSVISITQGNVMVVPTLSLVTGDVNGDNILDLRDYNSILNVLGSSFTSSSPLPSADINDDGVSDLKDLNTILREFSVQSGR